MSQPLDNSPMSYKDIAITFALSLLVIATLAFLEYKFKPKVEFKDTFIGQVYETRKAVDEKMDEMGYPRFH